MSVTMAGRAQTPVEWSDDDRKHLAHLAECDEPQWIAEVASRAQKYIKHLEHRLAIVTPVATGPRRYTVYRCAECEFFTENPAARDLHSDMYDHLWAAHDVKEAF